MPGQSRRPSTFFERNLDRIGIGISGLCVVHCLAVPFVLVLLPLFALAAWVHLWLHVAFAVVVVPTTLVAMYIGYRRHRSRRVVSLMGSGLAVVLTALLIGHSTMGVSGETAVTIAGSSLLIIGHWRNWRITGSCRLRPS